MPEGPELHLASLFVNRMCEGVVFTGAVEKSDVSKCPEVPFSCDTYRIKAQSRGKEVRLTLTPIKSDNERKSKTGQNQSQQPMDVVFRFGMSGSFRFTTVDELPKHAHLRFYTNETPPRALSFVDARRFGSWQPNGTWQAARGPCIMFEYESFRWGMIQYSPNALNSVKQHQIYKSCIVECWWRIKLKYNTVYLRNNAIFFFRENILSNLSDKAFDRPICEALLNQMYFNGIGNYLRAEILYRWLLKRFLVFATSCIKDLVHRNEFISTMRIKAHCPVESNLQPFWFHTETSASLIIYCHVNLFKVENRADCFVFQITNPTICQGQDSTAGTRDSRWR